MTPSEYLTAVLKSQTFTEDSDELAALRGQRQEVENLLRKAYGQSPSIRYGGSMSKGTMIRESYDLDIICYFPHGDTGAGKNLKEIFEDAQQVLSKEYLIKPKTSAIRLLSLDGENDFHIDVVPGRFVEGNDGDVFLYQSSAEKERLKTNLDVHIKHIKGSGVAPAIRLMKLWGLLNRVGIKTFGLELLVIEVLKDKKDKDLESQLTLVFETLRDNVDELSIEDPANPNGNDLSELLNASIRWKLSSTAKTSLAAIEHQGWAQVFGELANKDSEDSRRTALASLVSATTVRPKPYANG